MPAKEKTVVTEEKNVEMENAAVPAEPVTANETNEKEKAPDVGQIQTTPAVKKSTWNEDVVTPSLLSRIQKVRVGLASEKGIKKTGRNKYAGFDYFQLSDFIPTAQRLMLNEGLFPRFTIDADTLRAYLIIYDTTALTEEGEIPRIVFWMPINEKVLMTTAKQPVQDLGAANTYLRRYLYLNALEIVEDDAIDATGSLNDRQEVQKEDNSELIKDIRALGFSDGRAVGFAMRITNETYSSLEDIPSSVLARVYAAALKSKEKADKTADSKDDKFKSEVFS